MKKERIILKISGAALRDKANHHILSSEKLQSIAKQIKLIHKKYDIGIVVGGGNIWRGGTSDLKLYREKWAHYMGMVATIINSLALKEALVKIGVNTEVHSLLPSPHIATTYDAKKVNLTLERHRVVILAGGTGKPFFSTDTGAAKDAIELKCKYIVMGKDGVDGVYSGDPKLHKNVIRYKQLTFKEAIDKKLKVMDIAAMQMCQKHNIKIIVFNMERENAIINALVHKIPTTIVSK